MKQRVVEMLTERVYAERFYVQILCVGVYMHGCDGWVVRSCCARRVLDIVPASYIAGNVA